MIILVVAKEWGCIRITLNFMGKNGRYTQITQVHNIGTQCYQCELYCSIMTLMSVGIIIITRNFLSMSNQAKSSVNNSCPLPLTASSYKNLICKILWCLSEFSAISCHLFHSLSVQKLTQDFTLSCAMCIPAAYFLCKARVHGISGKEIYLHILLNTYYDNMK